MENLIETGLLSFIAFVLTYIINTKIATKEIIKEEIAEGKTKKVRKYYELSKLELLLSSLIAVAMFIYLENKVMLIESYSYINVLLCSVLASSTVIDFKHKELPDENTLIIGLCAIPAIIQGNTEGLVIGLAMFTIFYLSSYLGSIGGGDIKIIAMLGLYLKYYTIIKFLSLSFFIGFAFGILLMLIGKLKMKDTFAFGPFLIFGLLLTI